MNFDIAALKRKMLVKYPFFGSVVASVEYKENIDIPTAATDGKTIYYNPSFLESLSVEEQTFVFAHEVCHIAFNHILRSDGKEHQVWNIATDAVINAFLKRDGLKMIEGVVDIADAINYDAEQLYDRLLAEKQQQQGQNSNSQQSQGSSGNSIEQKEQDEQNKTSEDVGHDTHSMWEDAVKKHNEEQSKGTKKESLFDKLFNRDKQNEKDKKSEVEKKQEECENLGEKDSFKKNRDEKKRELEKLKEEIAKQAGTTTNEDIRNVTNIGRAKPLIDWRYILREAIKYDVDWSYKNAYIEDGVVSANLEEQPMPETEIVLDTSGSINEVLLKNFLRECKNILQHSRVKVGCFDTKFYGFHEIRTEEDIENMKFQGGGGTNFDVAVGAFSRRVENKIIFTDGEANMPKIPMDAIWIVFGGTKINPKGGKVIAITEEQLERLYSFEMDKPSNGRSR